MISSNIKQKSPMRGPFLNKVLSLLDLSNKQPKGDVFGGFPSLVVTENRWRLAQVSKAMCQSANKWTTRRSVMYNTYDGRLPKRTIDHHISFEYVRCHAEHSELKLSMLCHQLQQ